MSVDLSQALGFELKPADFVYDERDVSLYALSIGAAADPVDPEELKYVYELNGAGFYPFPTFPAVFPFSVMWQILEVPGLEFNPMLLLHGEQYLELKRPLPTKATITNYAKISQIYDKGKGALVLLDISSRDEKDEEVAFNQIGAYIRGIGGFGGDRGPATPKSFFPETGPAALIEEKTMPTQALLYRLSSGDGNPLHADPQMAAIGGFARPILHGLCTFGFAARAVLKRYAGNDPERFKSISVRFTRHVFPGETITTEMWPESENAILFRVRVKERDDIVITNGKITLQEN